MPSPVIELNRAVAVSMAYGPQAGLDLLDKLAAEPSLQGYHLLPSVRGDLLMKLGRPSEAQAEFERAAALTRNAPERELSAAAGPDGGSSGRTGAVSMTGRMRIVPMTPAYARDIVTWRYDPPYDCYDMTAASAAFLAEPASGFFALVDETGLIGFRSFGADGQVPGGEYDTFRARYRAAACVPISPARAGPGGHRDRAGLRAATVRPAAFRVTIATFNVRAQRVVAIARLPQRRQLPGALADGRSFEMLIRCEPAAATAPGSDCMATRTLLWRGLDAPRMEIVHVESLDRAHGTQIGVSYELRWRLDGPVLDLEVDGAPGVRVELGDADFFDLHHSAFFNSLPVARDRLLEPRSGPRVHDALRPRARADRRTRVAAVRAGGQPDGALPFGWIRGRHQLRRRRLRDASTRTTSSGSGDSMLIKACLNGGTSRRQHPAVPRTPEELAADARDAVRAGAGAIHVHPRDASGDETLEADAVLAAVRAVRAAVDVPVGVTTGIWAVGGDPARRLELVSGWTGDNRPDFASVNLSEPGARPAGRGPGRARHRSRSRGLDGRRRRTAGRQRLRAGRDPDPGSSRGTTHPVRRSAPRRRRRRYSAGTACGRRASIMATGSRPGT